jgi:DNA-binding phage protein
MIATKNYKEYLLKQLQDPEESAEYLNACLQDDDLRVFLLALQDVEEAMGDMEPLKMD